MGRLFWIGFGGFVGTVARHLLSLGALQVLGSGFAYGTLAVNVVGSFLLGVIMCVARETSLMDPTVQLTLTTGFCGGFTTYSTFNYESLRYFQEGAVLLGILYVSVTLVTCLVVGLLGWSGAHLVLSR